MDSHNYTFVIFILCCTIFQYHVQGAENLFNINYYPLWGKQHFSLVGGNEVQLLFDASSGSGFRSKLIFGSGSFRIRMKTPDKLSDGVVTAFYLNDAQYGQDSSPHDEVDFEIFGKTHTLQTNVFADDYGQREQRFKLWFDPSKDFHTYTILWNTHHILFIVDDIPIRVYWRVEGVYFPWKPMRIEASTWNADWAGEVDWSQTPFISHFQDFGITACSPPQDCASPGLWWNQKQYSELSPQQLELMRSYRKKYMIYDYCTRYGASHPECKVNI